MFTIQRQTACLQGVGVHCHNRVPGTAHPHMGGEGVARVRGGARYVLVARGIKTIDKEAPP
jgi:hypothetical protein